MIDTTTATCASALITNWISLFGLQIDITSDRGPQFTSDLWSAIAQLLVTQIHHTTTYHPKANGLLEIFHRHLKSSLKARCMGLNWVDKLPWVLLGIRTAPKEDLRCSTAELVYGTPLTLPVEFITPFQTSAFPMPQHIIDELQKLVPRRTYYHAKITHHSHDGLQSTKFVFVRRDTHRPPMQHPYYGPYRVLDAGTRHLC